MPCACDLAHGVQAESSEDAHACMRSGSAHGTRNAAAGWMHALMSTACACMAWSSSTVLWRRTALLCCAVAAAGSVAQREFVRMVHDIERLPQHYLPEEDPEALADAARRRAALYRRKYGKLLVRPAQALGGLFTAGQPCSAACSWARACICRRLQCPSRGCCGCGWWHGSWRGRQSQRGLRPGHATKHARMHVLKCACAGAAARAGYGPPGA